MMRMSEQGYALIRRWEGFSAEIYCCPAGKLTIGFGHLVKKDEKFPAAGISVDDANKLLEADISYAEQAVARLVAIPLEQHQFDALVSLAYNIGVYAFEKSTLLLVLNRGETDYAAREFNRWVYAGNRISPGLGQRRRMEMALFKGELPPE